MKVLVIKNLSDIDIILEDGSYAFSWAENDSRTLQCFQNRITEKLDSIDEFEKGKSNSIDLDYDTIIDFVKEAIDWLTCNSVQDAVVTIVELKDRKLEDLINEFLQLK